MTSSQKVWVADDCVRMTEVLDLLDWSYHGTPSQTPCPIHKGGTERKASARVHFDGLYCFTCGKQYRPTEVYSAVRRVSREDAADYLLGKFPPESGAVRESLEGWGRPRGEASKPSVEALVSHAEGHLRRFRHKSDLELYREWARRLDEFASYLAGVGDAEQQRQRLYAFRDEMVRSLSERLSREVVES